MNRPAPVIAPTRYRREDCKRYMGACDTLAAEAEAKPDPFMVRFWEGARRVWEDRYRRGYD